MIPSTNSETVLVVDDNEAIRELLEILLCRDGYRVLSASDGPKALRLARATPGIDLLLSDLDMPGMRGDELARHFVRVHPTARVAFVSSDGGPPEDTPDAEFLAKPFTAGELRSTVHRALRGREEVA